MRWRAHHQLRQRGAAILMALFIAALATLIVTGLFWNQFIVLRTIENQQLTTQSRMLLAGALDWARAILRADTNGFDAMTEAWAQPLAETPLDQLGETSDLASRATIAGNIEDAQARMNLRNLVGSDGQIAPIELNALRRLCAMLGMPAANADLIAVAMAESFVPPGAGGVTAPGSTVTLRPLPLVQPQDLYGVRGLDAQMAATLIPYVAILPNPPAPVNVNSATAEVIAARVNLDLTAARAIVAERDRIGYFRDVADFRNRLPRQGADMDTSMVSTTSNYFLVHGQVKLDRATTRVEALVFRPGAGGTVRVLWQRELS
jgi:general secretion pathway protein K